MGYSDLQGLGCKQAAYDNIMQRPDEPLRSYIVRYSRLFMNQKNYSLGDTFKVALKCELKAIASERRHMKCNAGLTNQVEVVQPQALLQSKGVSEVHVHNPNYKGKNYDPNFQAKRTEAAHPASHNSKQQQHSSTMANQYKTMYHKPASTYGASNNNALLNSS